MSVTDLHCYTNFSSPLYEVTKPTQPMKECRHTLVGVFSVINLKKTTPNWEGQFQYDDTSVCNSKSKLPMRLNLGILQHTYQVLLIPT